MIKINIKSCVIINKCRIVNFPQLWQLKYVLFLILVEVEVNLVKFALLAETLLKLMLNTNQSINQTHIVCPGESLSPFYLCYLLMILRPTLKVVIYYT